MLPAQAKNQSGQILVIFLLVLVVGLAITLSIASRTVTDIRQTTTSDESNRSYFAAESGVEKALRLIEDTPTSLPSGTLDLSGVNRSQASYTAVALPDPTTPAGQIFDFPNPYAKDEVAQVSLMSDFNTLSTAGITPSFTHADTLNISWYNRAIADPDNTAIEVSIVTCTSCNTPTPTFDIKKMTFDPSSSRATSNHFCTLPTVTLPGTGNYKYQVALTLDAPACSNNDKLLSTDSPVMARIRFLYNTNPSTLGVSRTGAVLTPQGQTITSTGFTPSGVTRKLVVTRLYPSLPAIFDYVLFNGSSSCITKTNPPPC